MDPYVTILRAEAYAYHKEYVSKSPELYQAQTLKRIQAGADITTSAYIQARRQLEQIRRSVSRVFETVDLLITPTACVPPFAIADLARPEYASGEGTAHAAQHATLQYAWSADGLRSLWFHPG